jgi:hypothetical protein
VAPRGLFGTQLAAFEREQRESFPQTVYAEAGIEEGADDHIAADP